MSFFSKKITKEIREISINEKVFRITIIYEKRKNSRVSITKTGINIRITTFISKKEQAQQVEKFIKWAKDTILKKEISFTKNEKTFINGDILKLYDKEVTIEIIETNGARVSGKIDSEKIIIKIPQLVKTENKNDYLSKMISRLIAINYKEKITKKLSDFNNIHQFGKLNNVRLKNNSTNWGSCSSKNNINISIRLLLAPEWVVDYVLIHELSHLKHRNHSTSFWQEVEKAYPTYKEAEKWLKLNSSKCII